jgi:hypothetical protein
MTKYQTALNARLVNLAKQVAALVPSVLVVGTKITTQHQLTAANNAPVANSTMTKEKWHKNIRQKLIVIDVLRVRSIKMVILIVTIAQQAKYQHRTQQKNAKHAHQDKKVL